MSDALDKQISHFQAHLEELKDEYEAYVILPYTTAFTRAQANFNEVLEEQAKNNAALMEFMLTGFSLGGSLLLRVFSKTALSSVAKDVAINVICKHELTNTFKYAAMVEKSPIASFLLGQVWDMGEAYVKKEVTDAMTIDTQNFPILEEFHKHPLEVFATVKGFMLSAKIKVWKAADSLYHSTASDEDKLGKLKQIEASPFCRGPKVKLDIDRLATDIELAWWMTVLLSRDYIKEQGDFSGKRTPITVNPTSKEYPKSGVGGKYIQVDHFLLGEHDIANRINKVYKERTGSNILFKFHTALSGWAGDGSDLREKVTQETLLRADLMLQSIGFDNYQRHLTEYSGKD